MNTKFDKDQLKKETETERTTAQSNITYVKDDFFDNMSCEALDRVAEAENPKARGGWNYAEQRKIDMGTSPIPEMRAPTYMCVPPALFAVCVRLFAPFRLYRPRSVHVVSG